MFGDVIVNAQSDTVPAFVMLDLVLTQSANTTVRVDCTIDGDGDQLPALIRAPQEIQSDDLESSS